MPTFLQRYRDGEHEQVWSDLEFLGAGVRTVRYLADAQAVAEETMKRVRHNAETVVDRLGILGYQFYTQDDSTGELFGGMRQRLDVAAAIGDFPQKASLETGIDLLEQFVGQIHNQWKPVCPPSPSIATQIKTYEKSIRGPLPLSLKAWCEIVGSVSLVGTHPTLSFRVNRENPDPPLADPLEIFCTFDEEEDEHRRGHRLVLGNDDQVKAGIYGNSDAYCIAVPNRSADATFEDWHEASFVNYLHIAFRWGGFPGWQRYEDRPEKELAFLAAGLLPF